MFKTNFEIKIPARCRNERHPHELPFHWEITDGLVKVIRKLKRDNFIYLRESKARLEHLKTLRRLGRMGYFLV